MKGKFGTSMQSIEYRPKRIGVACKDCKYLAYLGGTTPYICNYTQKGRHYTSICKCKHFVKKEVKKTNKEKAIERWNARKEITE